MPPMTTSQTASEGGREALKACPHCGGPAKCMRRMVRSWPDVYEWRTFCDNHQCTLGMTANTEAEAIAAWNTRHGEAGSDVDVALDSEQRDAIDEAIEYCERKGSIRDILRNEGFDGVTVTNQLLAVIAAARAKALAGTSDEPADANAWDKSVNDAWKRREQTREGEDAKESQPEARNVMERCETIAAEGSLAWGNRCCLRAGHGGAHVFGNCAYERGWNEDAMLDAIEKAITPYIKRIPPVCDSHDRSDVVEADDGTEICEACHGDGFSGELGHFHADTVAIEIYAALAAVGRGKHD